MKLQHNLHKPGFNTTKDANIEINDDSEKHKKLFLLCFTEVQMIFVLRGDLVVDIKDNLRIKCYKLCKKELEPNC